LAVNKLTTVDIDDVHGIYCAPVVLRDGHWRRGPVQRVHVVLHRA
jgi:hypothetical protein